MQPADSKRTTLLPPEMTTESQAPSIQRDIPQQRLSSAQSIIILARMKVQNELLLYGISCHIITANDLLSSMCSSCWCCQSCPISQIMVLIHCLCTNCYGL